MPFHGEISYMWRKNVVSMHSRYLLPVFVLTAIFLLVAGCTQTSPATPPPTTVSPTTVATVPPETTVTVTTIQTTSAPTALTTGPVETIPSMYAVEVQVTRNTVSISPDIVATFRGGAGINFVRSVDVKVTRSDGQVKTGSLVKPTVGDTITLEGTREDDRVEVTVNLVDGKSYKIYDQILPFRAYH